MANLYDERVLGTRQKIALAQKLRESGQASLQGQMIGDRYVPASWTQHLAQGLKQGLGAYQEMKGEQEIKDIQRERAQATARAMNQMGMSAPVDVLTAAETPAQSPSLMKRAGALFSGEDQPQGVPAQPYQQTIAQNPNAQQSDAAMLGLMSIDPELGAGAIGLSNTRAVRAATAEKEKYERKQDELEAAAKVEAARLQREFLKGEHELTRAATAANRQAPQAPQGSVVEIVDPNDPTKMIKINSITGVPYGYSGAEPKAALRQEKADAAAEKQAKAREGFATELDTIESNYNYLNEHGGITNPEKGALANIGSYLSQATGPTLGAMGGTANQSARNTIEGARSRMIPMFKEATGMSSKQMDSNAELKAAKNTLTNPDADYASNMQAIAALKKAYTSLQSPAPEVAQPVATQPQAPSATGGFSIRPLP
jgi:hypothetical protein